MKFQAAKKNSSSVGCPKSSVIKWSENDVFLISMNGIKIKDIAFTF